MQNNMKYFPHILFITSVNTLIFVESLLLNNFVIKYSKRSFSVGSMYEQRHSVLLLAAVLCAQCISYAYQEGKHLVDLFLILIFWWRSDLELSPYFQCSDRVFALHQLSLFLHLLLHWQGILLNNSDHPYYPVEVDSFLILLFITFAFRLVLILQ